MHSIKNHNSLNRIKPLFYFLIVALLLNACIGNDDNSNAITNKQTKTFKDDRGNKIEINFPATRVLGLAPSLTELLYAVCPDSIIIGRTQNCNFPTTCLLKPVVNNYPVDFEGIVQLQPDIVFVQSGMTSIRDIKRLEELHVKVFYLDFETVSDVFNSFATISKIIGDSIMGQNLSESFFERIEDLKEEPLQRLRVLALASHSPIYAYGLNSIFTEKIYIAGGENAIIEELNSPYPEINSEYILKLNPDVILGGSFGKLDSTLFSIYPELKQLTAYKNKQIYAVNEDQMSRPSPRIIESIIELKKILKKSAS